MTQQKSAQLVDVDVEVLFFVVLFCSLFNYYSLDRSL